MKKFLWVLFVLLFCCGIGDFFLQSSFFAIRKIEVTSASPALQAIVDTALEMHRGQNLMQIELEKISSELLQNNKAIQSLSFERHWPNTLRAQVEEREAVALVFEGQALWSVDREGVAFAPSGEPLPLFWPLPPDHKLYVEALKWLAAEKPAEVNGLTWDHDLGLVVLVEKQPIRNAKVVLGRQNFSENWKKARDSLDYLAAHNLQAKKIDATYNKRAVVSL